MNFITVEGDFPFWRGFLVEEWRRLPHFRLLLSQAPALWRKQDYDAIEALPLVDGAIHPQSLERIVERYGRPAGALTVFEPAVGRTLEIQKLLGLPLLSRLPARALRNKAAMVDVMQDARLDVPKTVAGKDAEALFAHAKRDLAFPIVVKPSELAGKAGVKLARTDDDLKAAIRIALAESLPFEIDGRQTSVVEIFGCEQSALCQEYIDGREFSVEGYASCGVVEILGITEKITSGEPLFEELGHLQPARLASDAEQSIFDYTRRAAKAFALENTFFHLEVRIRDGRPYLMEINCRLGGDMIARVLELRSGLNVGEMLLSLAKGAPTPPPARFVGAAGVRIITAPGPGRIKRIHAPVLRSEREHAAFEVGIGDLVHAPKPGGVTRLGYILAAGENTDEVERRHGELAGEIRYELE